MLNPNAKLWVEALRSGEFTQAHGALHDLACGGFCCLGIACIVAWRNGVTVSIETVPNHATEENEWTCDGEKLFLPASVQAWLGLQSKDGTFEGSGPDLSLADKNDFGNTFAEIADVIESEPPGLFVEQVTQ